MRKSQQKSVKELPPPTTDSLFTPPHSTFSEEYVLAVCLIERDVFSKVKELLIEKMFYDPRHQIIYRTIEILTNQNKPVDLITVLEELDSKNETESIGGAKYLWYLSGKASNSSYLMYHARIIKQKYQARELISLCGRTRETALNEQVDMDELVEQTERSLYDLTISNSSLQLAASVAKDLHSELHQGLEEGKCFLENNYIPTGYSELDEILIGWGKSELIVVAGRPAMGKTTFVVSAAIQIAMEKKIPTGVFSVEKSTKQLCSLMISNVCGIPGENIKSGQLPPYEWGQLDYKIKNLYDAPLFIDDTVGLSVRQIWAKSRRMVKERGVKIIFIDYLQLLRGSKDYYATRYEEISDIIINLKRIARKLDVPVIVTSQMSRSSEEKTDYLSKKPKLNDLRDSGAIEEAADKVCLLYRPSFYNIEKDNKGKDMRGILNFIVAKNHDGKEGEKSLLFRGEYHSIESLDSWDLSLQTTDQEAKESQNQKSNPVTPVPF